MKEIVSPITCKFIWNQAEANSMFWAFCHLSFLMCSRKVYATMYNHFIGASWTFDLWFFINLYSQVPKFCKCPMLVHNIWCGFTKNSQKQCINVLLYTNIKLFPLFILWKDFLGTSLNVMVFSNITRFSNIKKFSNNYSNITTFWIKLTGMDWLAKKPVSKFHWRHYVKLAYAYHLSNWNQNCFQRNSPAIAMFQGSRERGLVLYAALEVSEWGSLSTNGLILDLHINFIRGDKKQYRGLELYLFVCFSC